MIAVGLGVAIRLLRASILLASACCTTAVAVRAQSSVDAFSRHRSVYRTIEQNLRRYRHIEADMDTLGLERQSTEGGRLGAYCDGTTIRLLVAQYYGETGNLSERFYFDRDSLLFVFRQLRKGMPDASNPYPRRTTLEEERFYFTGDRLIRWVGPKNRLKSVATRAARKEMQDLLNDARRLRASMPACKPRFAAP